MVKNRRNESTNFIFQKLQPLVCVLKFDIISCSLLLNPFSFKLDEIDIFCYKNKNQFSLTTDIRIMATLRSRKKLAAVSRETPESTRNNQSQNTYNLGIAWKNITQVSEEIEQKVT